MVTINIQNKMRSRKYIFLALLAIPGVLGAQEVKTSGTETEKAGLSETSAYSRVEGDGRIFENSPETDPAKALYGKLPGLVVNQGTGTNATNLSSLRLHGKAPLVLIDGFERSLGDIRSYELESIQVLKDAVSAALYGVAGANGVILVTTKRGLAAPLKVTARYQYGLRTPFRMPSFSNAGTWAEKLNEALELDGFGRKYNDKEIEAFRTGEYPYYYPNVNWTDEIYKSGTSNHTAEFTFRGGSQRFRYFAAMDYIYDEALYRNQSSDDRYNVNHYDTRLGLRGNIDVDITNTTFMKVGVMARLSQYNRANATGIDAAVYNTPSGAFPVKAENGLWGSTSVFAANNPVAMLNDKGAYALSKATILADIDLRQNLDIVTKGLSAEASVAFDYIGAMTDQSSKTYRYSEVVPSMTEDGFLTTTENIYGVDSKTLGHSSAFYSLVMRSVFEAKVDYSRTFSRHGVNAYVMYRQRAYTANGRNASTKTQELLMSGGYNYADRYLIDAVVNYSGSAYLQKGHRFNLYPAVSLGYVMSNEPFMRNSKAVSYLKFFVSGGLSGEDGNLSHELYLQTYGGGGSYLFNQNPSGFSGKAEGALPSSSLSPEKSAKISGGFDLKLLDDRLSLYAEAFGERRNHILVTAQNISGILGVGVKQLDMGEQKFYGTDFSVSWNDKTGDFSYGLDVNGAFLDSKLIEDGQAYQRYDYLYHKGNRVNQIYGLEFDGFFSCEEDILLSPKQTFSDVKPGDIRYKDQNDDGKIDNEDIVPLKGTTLPKFTFGFGLNLGYKNWELSADFSGRTSVRVNLLNSPLYKPLVSNSSISDDFLKREVTWTKDNADKATMPRLTTLKNDNNYRNSSLWYKDGSFIKLRNLIISYTFPKKMVKFSDMKVYLQGTNLFSLDRIGFADPEQLAAAYPATRAFWAGVKFNF